MRNLNLLIISLVLLPFLALGQEIPILLDVNMEAYEVLENPISLNNGEIWQQNTQYPIYFDFDFEVNGSVYNAILVYASSGIKFSGYSPPGIYAWVSEWGGAGQLLDQGTDESLSPIDYEIVGDIGSRILKIQWTNAGILGGDVDDPDDFVDFQMWICEGSNRIEIHYGASQTSEYSFGYNDGPGLRYVKIDGDWGICVWGYPDMPSWDWRLFEGPTGGCLLDGVPSEDMVFNFFPNPTVSIKKNMERELLDFKITQKNQDELNLVISDFQNTKAYELEIFNMQGIKVLDLVLDNMSTNLREDHFSQGLYIFTLKLGQNIKVKKVILR